MLTIRWKKVEDDRRTKREFLLSRIILVLNCIFLVFVMVFSRDGRCRRERKSRVPLDGHRRHQLASSRYHLVNISAPSELLNRVAWSVVLYLSLVWKCNYYNHDINRSTKSSTTRWRNQFNRHSCGLVHWPASAGPKLDYLSYRDDTLFCAISISLYITGTHSWWYDIRDIPFRVRHFFSTKFSRSHELYHASMDWSFSDKILFL